MNKILWCPNCKEVFKPKNDLRVGEIEQMGLENSEELYNEVRNRFAKIRPDDISNWRIAVYRCKCKTILAITE